MTDKKSPEISLRRSRGTEESGVCNTKKVYIYQRMLPRRSLRSKTYMEGDHSRDRHKGSSLEVKTVDSKYIEQGVSDMLQRESSCQTDGSAMRDFELQEKYHRLVKGNDVVAIGEERTEVEPPTVSTYRKYSGELNAENVDQHMAILPKVDIPAAEIFLEDNQAGDLWELLSGNQTKHLCRLVDGDLIWANRYLLFGKGNALPPAACGAVCILMSETLTRSHKG